MSATGSVRVGDGQVRLAFSSSLFLLSLTSKKRVGL